MNAFQRFLKLTAALIGIVDETQVMAQTLRGALFETLVVNELLKRRCNLGLREPLCFWRDNIGTEVDVTFERGSFSAIHRALVCGVEDRVTHDGVDGMPWAGL